MINNEDMVNLLSDLHRANDVLGALVFDKVLFSKHTRDPLPYFCRFPQLKQAPKSKITSVFPHHSGKKLGSVLVLANVAPNAALTVFSFINQLVFFNVSVIYNKIFR